MYFYAIQTKNISFLSLSKKLTKKVNMLPPTLLKMKIKIATLNLCNGLQQKKNLVKELITHEQIDILCMQETQINFNIDHSLLSFPGYIIETEKNSLTSRTGMYINNKVMYTRRQDLEGQDSHLVIIDLAGIYFICRPHVAFATHLWKGS